MAEIRVVILTTQRSGSHLLESCLASHPEIEPADRELLEDFPPQPRKIIGDFFRGGNTRVRIFRLMYFHASQEVLNYLKEQPIYIIHLIREDALHRGVSHWINRHKDTLGRESAISFEEIPPVQVEVSTDWISNQIKWVDGKIAYVRRELNRAPYLEVTYEELTGGEGLEVSVLPKEVTQRLLTFLDLEYYPLTTKLCKQNKGSLESIVINYDELITAMEAQ